MAGSPLLGRHAAEGVMLVALVALQLVVRDPNRGGVEARIDPDSLLAKE